MRTCFEAFSISLIYYRVNCSFYFKIGACRHGDRCSRLHNKPTFSQVKLENSGRDFPNIPHFLHYVTALLHFVYDCLSLITY